MKTIFAVILSLTQLRASATEFLLATDNFDQYSVGPIAGQTSENSGWASGWLGDQTNYLTAAISTSNLSYKIPNRGVLESGAGCLQLTTSPEPVPGTQQQVSRKFTPVRADLFVGFTFQLSQIGSGSEKFMIDVLDSLGLVIKTIEIRPSMNTVYPGSHRSSGLGMNRSGNLSNGTNATTYFALFEIRREATYYKPDYWINPANFIDRNYAGGFTTNNDNLTELRFRVSSSDSTGPATILRIDNLRIGLTWDSVVPPLPTNVSFPNFAFEPAYRLVWYADVASRYRVEASGNMLTWDPITDFSTGQNKNMELFIPRTEPREFFRVVATPIP